MTWGDLRTLIRMRLGDSTGKVWTNAQLLSFANETMEEMATDAEANTKHVLLPLTASQRTYTLPTDCYEVRTVRINGQKAFGTTSYRLEDLDSQYLTGTGRSQFYYLEDNQTIAFYPVPTWTDSTTTFTSEFGEVVQWNDGTANFTFDSELGLVINAIDDASSIEYVLNQLVGAIAQVNNGPLVSEITYVYQPPDISLDSDTPDLPTYMQYALMYGVLEKAFSKEGQGKNETLMQYYQDRFDELTKEWFSRNREFARGSDQFMSQEPVSWGSDLDFRMRVWP